MLPKKKKYRCATNYNRKTFGVYHYNRDEKEYHLTVDGENILRSKTLEGYNLYVLKPSKNSNVIEEYEKKMNDFHQFKAITGYDYKRSNYDDTEMSLYIWNQFRPQEVEFGRTTEMEEEWVHLKQEPYHRNKLISIINSIMVYIT